MNTLSLMSRTTAVLAQKHPVELRDAPSGAAFPAVEAQVKYREDAQGIPILFTLVRVAAAVVAGALVVAYFIVVLGVQECKAIWTRGARVLAHYLAGA
jgi:hypothetical protein